MISRKNTFFLGIFIIVIPFLGIPTSAKTFFIILSGLMLIAFSVSIVLPRKNLRTRPKKEKVTAVFVENMPVYPTDDTMEKTEPQTNSILETDIK